MADQPSMSVRLFGTEQPVAAPQILRAGPLTAELEAGNLRYIRFGGDEVLRAISFIVRHRDWGTYDPDISNLSIDGSGERFRVTYDAVARDSAQAFAYAAEIEGSADGNLTFCARGRAESDFLTNRTGFVVLHPVDGVAGRPARVEHVDGRVVETEFPDLVDPVQPMMELRAITHQFAPGLSAKTRMEGDAFEMEDQRNWTDASYKTYVRPLALPWPYTLKAGSELEQCITVTIEGRGRAQARDAAEAAPGRVTIGAPLGAVPALGFGLDPDHAAAAVAAADRLRAARPAHVVCHFDARRGHGRAELETQVAAARAMGAAPWLEFIVTTVGGFEDEVADAGRMAAALGSPFPVVLVSPASDLKSTPPGAVWPPAPDLAALYGEARRAFAAAKIGGGMFSTFTELNRKRPPLDRLDLLTFTTSALVHAGDDRSATESLEALPYITRSVAAIAGGKPWNAGPSVIGMRANPYGAGPADNPQNIRQAMNRMDPRQRGLLGAAWYLGYFAHMARGGATWVTLGAGVGEHGIAYAPMAYKQPHFDSAGGVYPAFHVFKGLAALQGATLLDTRVSPVRDVQAVAARRADGKREIWLANLTGGPVEAAIEGGPAAGTITLLDAENFVAATAVPDAPLDTVMRPLRWSSRIALSAYAVARIVEA